MTRPVLGTLGIALAVAGAAACSDEKPAAPAPPVTTGSAPDNTKRCEQLAKLCGDKEKHVAKILDACKAVLAKPGCDAPGRAVFDCYERDVCGTTDKVWALEDLEVLAGRKGKCLSERTSAASCTAKDAK